MLTAMRPAPSIDRRLRLMNIAQIRATADCGGAGDRNFDIRATCAEITQTPERTVIVLLNLYRNERDPDQQAEPRLVGRIEISGPTTIIDPSEIDCHSWGIANQHGAITLFRPYETESIWQDRSFGREDLTADLSALYEQHRRTMQSLIANERLLAGTPEEESSRSIHQANVLRLSKMAESIDKKIILAEAK